MSSDTMPQAQPAAADRRVQSTGAEAPRLKQRYNSEILQALRNEFQHSNVMVIDSEDKPTRVGYRKDEEGRSIRVSRRTGKDL